MKHVHYDMIVAKAENMDLVVFFNPSPGYGADKWEEATTTLFPAFHPDTEYFLCLPQHKDACLHWLNWGDVQHLSSVTGKWVDLSSSAAWSDTHLLMTTECELRIKPKKEKRLIVYRNDVVYGPYLSIDDINTDFVLTGQVVEIEVEV